MIVLKQYWRTVVIVILTIGIIAFIFTNSLQNGEESNAFSAPFVEWAERIFDPNDKIPTQTFNYAIRKLAHITEFTMIGLALGGLMCSAYRAKKQWHIAAVLFWGLSIAVIDEYIQSFTARTSSVSDVLIDFVGVLIGLGLTALVYHLTHKKQ